MLLVLDVWISSFDYRNECSQYKDTENAVNYYDHMWEILQWIMFSYIFHLHDATENDQLENMEILIKRIVELST